MKPPSDQPIATPPGSAGELRPGQSVGGDRYLLKQHLGHGGMGVVWLAHDKRLIEPVALKFLPSQIAHDPLALGELRRETLRSRKLSHPNIVRIYDLFEAPNELPFISMEYVDGPDLHYLRARRSSQVLTWKFLLPVVRQLCSALDYAHSERVLHRDLKPANLMLDSKERLKLADFGLACVLHDSINRLSGHPSTAGTLQYMSPQQADGLKPSITDDIYSLGATLYELLTSQPPFFTGDLDYQIRNNRPQPLPERLLELGLANEIPSDVAALIMACLAKDPEHRPPSAKAIMDWLDSAEKTPVAPVIAPAAPVPVIAISEPPPPPPTPKKAVPPPPPAPAPVPSPAPAPVVEKIEAAPKTAPVPSSSPASESSPVQTPAPVPASTAEEAGEPGAARPYRRAVLLSLVAIVLLGLGVWFGISWNAKKSRDTAQLPAPSNQSARALAQAPPKTTPAATPVVPFVSQVGADGYEVLFNGRDLSGWDGDPRLWSVTNGVILGRFNAMMGGPQVNTALFYRGAPLADFELRFLFRASSGAYDVLYRARQTTNYQAFGYACTLWVGSQVLGGIHELFLGGTRGLTMHQYAARQAASFLKTNDWNEMVITVQSNRFEHRLNGALVCAASDAGNDLIPAGSLALALDTICSTGPNGVEFKDIRLKRLAAANLAIPAPAPNPAGPSASFSSIFNGKDLSGWRGEPKLWIVRDGAITGIVPRTAPTRNYFLFWEGGELGDFELRLAFRLGSGAGNPGGYLGNYGVYYWTRRPDPVFPGGLEYSIKKETMGSLYYHLDAISYTEEAKFNSAALYHSETWNQVYIIARGRRLTHYFNNVLSGDRTIPYTVFTSSGGLALEMNHNKGWESIIQFRDIALKRL